MDIEPHLKLARIIAKRWCKTNSEMEYEDIYQEACLGLLDAAKRYDGAKGVKFNTFAGIRIKGQILDAIRKNRQEGFLGLGRAIRNGFKPETISLQFTQISEDDEESYALEELIGEDGLEGILILDERLAATKKRMNKQERTFYQYCCLLGHSRQDLAKLWGLTEARVWQVGRVVRDKLEAKGIYEGFKFADKQASRGRVWPDPDKYPSLPAGD